ncbi:aminomethyltransferase, mitochondrial [Phlebotomus papatasi]|nr:aminomethyltransferase, mitochondrial [Phlebotomus papatasi]
MTASRIVLRHFGRSLQVTRGFASNAAAEKTSLYDFHVANQGKMVNFGGFLLPVQYGDFGIAASHNHTRTQASIFDVSHMLQTYVRGTAAIDCLESISTADIAGLPHGSSTLTVFTNTKGGILDDLIITRLSDSVLYIVSNAGCRQQDMELMSEAAERFRRRGKNVDVEFLEPKDRALLAVQGPDAVKCLQEVCDYDLRYLHFMTSTKADVAGIENCRVTRCGYTGEDGVEISIPADRAVHIAETLLGSRGSSVKMAGLGARDSLRLEAGLCLYGSDIDQETTPIEANLAWLVAKRRRTEGNFPGAKIIVDQLKNGCSRRRIGIRSMGGPPARHGVEVFTKDTKEKLGSITSGCPSPTAGGNVAMGYVKESHKATGTKVQLKIREKFFPAEVAKMPFVKANYYTKPK